MRNKIAILLLLIGGILFIGGATMSSLNSNSGNNKDSKKDVDRNKFEGFSYMPALYKISDDDSYIYLLPFQSLSDDRV